MTIDKQALRKAAIAATGGQWVFSRSGVNSNVQAPIELQKGGRALVVLCKLNNAGWSGQIQTENNAKFIAAASPETVLALLDELEAKDKQVAELQARDQPKFVQCWSCKRAIEVLAIADCDGYCPRCAAPIDLDDEPYAAGIGKGE
ncbi:MAG: ead/Ea22-like family protein [Citrobacter sp.]|uniref:ead/Ea22-like family protein n=1 Tax=Citrobacter sp. TaxID=1896336 RepID=UPI0029095170|nr:ead/Ea22-like family protein [Citrobacter sp.]MDU7774256.1 ead/Ea22-like family protein [Citrobacter sp.]